MFEINDDGKEKIKIRGKEYEVSRPDVKTMRLLNDVLTNKKDNPVLVFDTLVDFLSKLGIDKEVSESLQIDQLHSLIGHLSGSKKN